MTGPEGTYRARRAVILACYGAGHAHDHQGAAVVYNHQSPLGVDRRRGLRGFRPDSARPGLHDGADWLLGGALPSCGEISFASLCRYLELVYDQDRRYTLYRGCVRDNNAEEHL